MAVFVTKKKLGEILGLRSHRIIDTWVAARRISYLKLGHRTLLFDPDQVRQELSAYEVKSVLSKGGRK